MTSVPPWVPPSAQFGVPLRSLRIALVLGAVVDLSGGIPLLLFPEQTAAWLGEGVRFKLDFWPMYASVFLFVLPVFYLIGAIDPARNIGIVLGGILGRLAGAVFYFACFILLEKKLIFGGLAVMNLLFALYYAGALGAAGRTLIRGALRPSQ